ncbi:hypothetical protein NDU88_000432 [Pleurodeles waltl]|uniref:Uncharacterized protein n=1 Tax=Pleurodeles waltl TaxID=8319 RepID=A0AAV7V6S5_PLEWA|nr:hypothetical protein NDU88_000432 [Pleurodeles waltl]
MTTRRLAPRESQGVSTLEALFRISRDHHTQTPGACMHFQTLLLTQASRVRRVQRHRAQPGVKPLTPRPLPLPELRAHLRNCCFL